MYLIDLGRDLKNVLFIFKLKLIDSGSYSNHLNVVVNIDTTTQIYSTNT